MNLFDINEAKAVYAKGGNVTEFLRSQLSSSTNTSDIIEIAYDLQAGSYIKSVKENTERSNKYAKNLASKLKPYVSPNKSLLDAGAGELTTLSLLMSHLNIIPSDIYAFDISWSRIHLGLNFWKETVKHPGISLFPFVADIKQIPIASNSIDIVTTNHALEPNGGSLIALLKELLRICKDRLILFEPSYELNSDEGRARMDRLGYIKDIEPTLKNLGASIQDIIPLEHVMNPLNPTVCYIIKPPYSNNRTTQSTKNHYIFTAPGSDFKLVKQDGFYLSADTGLAFPVLDGIPILKSNSGIIATSLF